MWDCGPGGACQCWVCTSMLPLGTLAPEQLLRLGEDRGVEQAEEARDVAQLREECGRGRVCARSLISSQLTHAEEPSSEPEQAAARLGVEAGAAVNRWHHGGGGGGGWVDVGAWLGEGFTCMNAWFCCSSGTCRGRQAKLYTCLHVL